MISSLASSQYITQSFRLIQELGKGGALHAMFLTSKVRSVASPYLTSSLGAYHCGVATVELGGAAKEMFQGEWTRQKTDREYLLLHGALIGVTGACGLLEGLNHFGIIQYGLVANALCTVGSVFFLYANVMELAQNLKQYRELRANERAASHQHDVMGTAKASLIWGIMSNLGYIVATAFVLLNTQAAIAFVFGVVGTFSGVLKFLCDWLGDHSSQKT